MARKRKPKGIPLSKRLASKANGEPKAFCTVVVADDGGAVAQTTCETIEQAYSIYRAIGKVRDELGERLRAAGLTDEDLDPLIELPP